MRTLTLLLLLCAPILVWGQDPKGPPSSEAEYLARYADRITKTHIYGVYIPEDIPDALRELDRLTPEESQVAYRDATEERVLEKLFYSFGRWMIYNWGFYEGSRLSHHLREAGVNHPEDMAKLLMLAYHRKLNEKPLDIEKEIADIRERVAKEDLERKKKGEVLHEERRVVDPATRRERQ